MSAEHLPLEAPKGLAGALGQPVHLEGRDLVIEVDGAVVKIPYLSGELVPAGDGDFVDVESLTSFDVRIDALEVVIAEQTIQEAMSAGPKPSFSLLTVRTEGDSLALQGSMNDLLGMPFNFRAEPHVSPTGALVLDLEKVKVLGVGVKGFIGAFQGAIEAQANKKGHLIEVDKEQLVIDPFPFAGPPVIRAEFTSFEVRDHEIIARLGDPTACEDQSGAVGLVLSGGVLRSGHMIVLDTTLRLVAADGGDLVLDPSVMASQIERGFMKQAHDGSVTIYLAAPNARPEVPPSG